MVTLAGFSCPAKINDSHSQFVTLTVSCLGKLSSPINKVSTVLPVRVGFMVPTCTWNFKTFARATGSLARFARDSAGMLPNASSVGAKTVSLSAAERTPSRPAALTSLRRVLKFPAAVAVSMMFAFNAVFLRMRRPLLAPNALTTPTNTARIKILVENMALKKTLRRKGSQLFDLVAVCLLLHFNLSVTTGSTISICDDRIYALRPIQDGTELKVGKLKDYHHFVTFISYIWGYTYFFLKN